MLLRDNVFCFEGQFCLVISLWGISRHYVTVVMSCFDRGLKPTATHRDSLREWEGWLCDSLLREEEAVGVGAVGIAGEL